MVEPIDRTISSTITTDDGIARGASLLIAEEGRFLVAARPPVVTDNRILVNLTGVGGWVEASEFYPAAVQRESLEETGSSIRLIDLHETLVVRGVDDIERLCIIGEAAPAAIVYCRMGTPAFDPWSSDYDSVVAVTVYTGVLTRRPQIVAPEEHPFFLWVYPEQMISLSDSELPLDYLIADGAEMYGDFHGDTSRVIVRMADSIPSLLTALGPAAFGFLGDIARLTTSARAE